MISVEFQKQEIDSDFFGLLAKFELNDSHHVMRNFRLLCQLRYSIFSTSFWCFFLSKTEKYWPQDRPVPKAQYSPLGFGWKKWSQVQIPRLSRQQKNREGVAQLMDVQASWMYDWGGVSSPSYLNFTFLLLSLATITPCKVRGKCFQFQAWVSFARL